tara:strand:+ start:306 stop:935 length:630 start_codon:yes stop_codon:yes gene_type:complete
MSIARVSITAADAVSIASLVNAAATTAGAKITPVLGEIEVRLDNGNLTATATDRFMAATYSSTATGQDTVFRLTAAAAKFLAANVKRVNKHYDTPPVEFVISQEDRAVTISHGGATFTDNWNFANFPAILNLIDEWQPAAAAQPVKMRAEFLARLYKFVDAFIKVDYWLLELGATINTARPERAGPLMATAGKFRVIIMPNTYNAADRI